MAIGDKFAVIMESEKDIPYGVPSLDKNTKVIENEIPEEVIKKHINLHNVDTNAHEDLRRSITSSHTDFTNHINNTSNPHNVTKSQLGLGNVENKSSSTIRSEITKQNIISALGYVPVENTVSYGLATHTSNGLMSSDDKKKLDGIAAGATAYTHPTYDNKSSALYKITVDKTGHVSAATPVTKSDISSLGIPSTDTDTHYTTHMYAGTSVGTGNAVTSNGSTHLIIADDTTIRDRLKLSGKGFTEVSSDDSGNITIDTTINQFAIINNGNFASLFNLI